MTKIKYWKELIIGLSAVITIVFVSMLDMHKYNYIRYNRYYAGYVEINKD